MAKTESTAVNDLIKIATTQTPLANDPSDDLMFTSPPKGRDRSTKMVAPRPPMRVPHGTQEHAIAMPAIRVGGSPAKGTATVSPPPQIARTRTPLPPPLPSRPSISVPPIAASKPALPVPPLAEPPLAAPEFLSDSEPAKPIAPRTPRPASPSEYPVVSAVHSLPLAPAAPWADADNSIDIDPAQFRGDNTAQVARPRTNLEWVIKLAPWMGVMVAIGVAVGAYIVIDSKSATKATAPAVEVKVVAAAAPVAATDDSPVVAAPAIAAVPTETAAAPTAVTPPNLAAVAEELKVVPPETAVAPTSPGPAQPSIAAPAAGALTKRPVFVDVRIDSKPTGATVTLVDRGKQIFLGTTPISTAVDPSRTYEIVFAHARRPTQSAQLDPKATTRLAITLGRSGTPTTEIAKPISVARPVAAAAPAAKPAKDAKVAKIVEPTWEAPAEPATKAEPARKVEAPAAEKADKAVGGSGVLMISSKPPCEIHIDGKATGLMTPQRSLPLSAGKHKITLVNAAEKIKKTITVDITANETSKVIQNLMQ